MFFQQGTPLPDRIADRAFLDDQDRRYQPTQQDHVTDDQSHDESQNSDRRHENLGDRGTLNIRPFRQPERQFLKENPQSQSYADGQGISEKNAQDQRTETFTRLFDRDRPHSRKFQVGLTGEQ